MGKNKYGSHKRKKSTKPLELGDLSSVEDESARYAMIIKYNGTTAAGHHNLTLRVYNVGSDGTVTHEEVNLPVRGGLKNQRLVGKDQSKGKLGSKPKYTFGKFVMIAFKHVHFFYPNTKTAIRYGCPVKLLEIEPEKLHVEDHGFEFSYSDDELDVDAI